MIGIAKHFKVGRGTACGVLTQSRTSKPSEVDCVRCRKTKEFSAAWRAAWIRIKPTDPRALKP